MPGSPASRRIGAQLTSTGVQFRLWAPGHKRVEVVLEGDAMAPAQIIAMEEEADGYYAVEGLGLKAGALYRFRLDNGELLIPDPASRYQPQGPHGPSQVVDPTTFRWSDTDWTGRPLTGSVIYEMHVGTFTREGTWVAAGRELAELAACGITVIEMMPVAEFAGAFGWGYDGVGLFAPYHHYGSPDDLRRFVDLAHRSGIAVVLDVVYNHTGPEGSYFSTITPHYFSARSSTEWGDAFNFDGECSAPVRAFFLANAASWVDEFHMDGLRIDATQAFFDSSPEHILAAIVRTVREAAGGRITIIIGESEPQVISLARPLERGGCGMDGLWNDDFHHTALVAITGRREAYFTDYLGTPQELISTAKWGYLYQGQRYRWQGKGRGTPALDMEPAVFISYLQNHDQIPNAGRGVRFHHHASPGRYRAMTAFFLLGPGTPLLFQGEEFAASSPFHYFADHGGELARKVYDGRKEFLAQFRSAATPEMQMLIPDPSEPATFEACKLDHAERQSHQESYDLHCDLLRLRHTDPVLSTVSRGSVDGAVLAQEALVLRWFGRGHEDRILLLNLGRDLWLDPASEPLLAPQQGMRWSMVWSSESPRYGGQGTPALETETGWQIPGQSAVLLAGQRKEA